MINFIYGKYQSERKNALIQMIKKDSDMGKKVFLLVPEQFAVEAERLMLKLLPPSAQLNIEVLNFSRLYNRACREYGGIRYNYITKPVKYCMMWKNLRELSPLLEVYGEVAAKDASFSDIVLSSADELKSCCIDASSLEAAAKKLPQGSALSKKLRDLSLIIASYENLISETFSDSADDLSRLSDILGEHDFFANTNVYIDAFTSFTAAEHRIIRQIFASADNTTITIPLSYPHEDNMFSASILDSEKRLTVSARKFFEPNYIIAENDNTGSKSIKYLADNLFTSNKENAPEGENDVLSISCSTPYTEAEAAARISLELLRQGYRCRDIVVIARNAEDYRGIIEPAFDKCSLPFYFSEKISLSSTPIVKFILSALRIKLYNYRTSDVITHLSTGLYDFSQRDIDIFEQYVTTWQIKGDGAFGSEFTMNPDGYVERLSRRAKSILDTANSLRERLISSLTTLFDEIESSTSIAEKCRAIYSFLVRAGVEDKLKALATREAERGNLREAEEYSRLYSTICDSLASLASAMSGESLDTELSFDELYELLDLFFKKSDIGSIPTSSDRIIIGSAATLRTDEPKCAIILGLSEGSFPATVRESGLLSFSERSALAEVGVELSGKGEFASSDELMYLRRAVLAPTEKLYLVTHKSTSGGSKATPSLPFIRAGKLFSKKAIDYSSHDFAFCTPTVKGAIPYLKDVMGTPLGEALFECALESDELSSLLGLADIPVSDTECKISEEIADKVFGKTMNISSTSLEKFITCHFNYYCENVLSLRCDKISRFDPANVGTFVHYVIEKLLSRLVTNDGVNTDISKKDIESMASELVRQYIEKITPKGTAISARLSHLYRRLYNTTVMLILNIVEEFRHSSFRPEFFELKTDGTGENPSAREFILNDGTRVVFSGIIDRVDIYKKNDGKVYIRVVDYKTGKKVFSLEDVKHGLNVQMLLYLFTLTNNKNEKFNERLGGTPCPAGVVYLSSNIPTLELGDYETDDAVIEKVQNGFKRSGLLLDDENVLEAMNDELSSKFLAGIRRKVDGTISGNALASPELFYELEKHIDRTLVSITEEMKSGAASAIPLEYAADACTHCNMKPICRHKDEKERR